MKAEITIKLTHCVNEDDLPEKVFERSSTIGVELPVAEDTDLMGAIENLVNSNMRSMVETLCTRVQASAAKYIEASRKAGIKQPQLGLENKDGQSVQGLQAAVPPGGVQVQQPEVAQPLPAVPADGVPRT